MNNKEINIGRAASNDIVLIEPEVSKYHAKIVFEGDGSLWIYDLNSSNGTFVNNRKIVEKQQLKLGDEVKLAHVILPWQDLILEPATPTIHHSPPKTSADSLPNSSPPVRKKTAPLWPALLLVAVIAFGFYAYSQDFWSVFDNLGQGGKGWKKKNKEIVYSVECLRDSSIIGTTTGILNDIKKEVIKQEKVEVSLAEELDIGREVKRQMDAQYRYITDGADKDRIDRIAKKLLAELKNKKFDYQWYIIDSKEINAFTAGGQIFISTGIINFAKDDDEIAAIIGHEIYHNELGHIKDKLKEIKIAKNILGEGFGEMAAAVASLLTASFNQENETYCDMYGLDLAVRAGYNGCAAINLWNRMSEKEESSDEFSKLFRSHPYSKERSRCIHHHIDHNYHKTCQQH